MKFKVVNFRPERISGWVYNDESPKETVKLELFIDDRKAAEPLCDKFRNELDGRDFANRRIGFVERVPVQFWDGETHEVTLKIRGSDVVLRQEKMTLPNVRLAADSDLSAEVLSTENGQVTGWAASASGTVRVILDVDGHRVDDADADRAVAAGLPDGAGFRLLVPARYFDDKEHRLVVRALVGESEPVEVSGADTLLRSASRPRVEGLIYWDGTERLTGHLLREPLPDLPLEIIAGFNGAEFARCETSPEDNGAFSLAIPEMSRMELGWDEVTLTAEPGGLSVTPAGADLLVSTIDIRMIERAKNAYVVSVWSGFALAPLSGVSLRVNADDAPYPLTFRMFPQNHYAEADVAIPGPVDLSARMYLVTDSGEIPFSGAAEPEAAPIVEVVEPKAVEIAEREGFSIVVPFDQGDVADALMSLAKGSDEALKTQTRYPEVSGHWVVGSDGRVQGWAIDTAVPSRAVEVFLCVDGRRVASRLADEPSMPLSTKVPVAAPCGFSFDLAGHQVDAPSSMISVEVDPGLPLPTTRRARVRWPLEARAYASPNLRLGQAVALVPPAATAALFSAVPADMTSVLNSIFGIPSARALQPNKSLANGLRRLGEFLVEDGRLLTDLMTGTRPLTGESRPRFVDFDRGVLADLPVTEATTAILAEATDWEHVLAALFGDAQLFPAVFNGSIGSELVVLERLRAASRLTSGRLLTLNAPLAPRDLPAAWTKAEALFLIDPSGSTLLDTDTAQGRISDALRALSQSIVESSAKRKWTGWLVGYLGGHGEWQADILNWAPRRRTAPTSVQPEHGVEAISVLGGYVELTMRSVDPPHRLVFTSPAGKVSLWRLPEAEQPALAEGGARGRWLFGGWGDETLTEPSLALSWVEAEDVPVYDVRLSKFNGQRPAGLPEALETTVRDAVHSEPAELVGGQLSVVAFDPNLAVTAQRVHLVETIAVTEEELAENPEAQDTVTVLETATLSVPGEQDVLERGRRSMRVSVALPARVLDGTPRALSLVLRRATGDEVLWHDPAFVPSDELLFAQIGGTANAGALQSLLESLAMAQRFAVLERYFANPTLASPHALRPESVFAVVTRAVVCGATGARFPRLAQIFGSVWSREVLGEKISPAVARTVIRTALKPAPWSGAPARFPHAPLVEAAVDIVMSEGNDNSPPDLVLELVAALSASRRHALALHLLYAALDRNEKERELHLAAVGVLLMLGRIDHAEYHALRALELAPRNNTALMALARCRARQGRSLEAAAAISGGKGFGQWVSKLPSYDQIKLIAGTDWHALSDAVATSADNATLKAANAMARQVQGAETPLEEAGFTLASYSKVKLPDDAFVRYRPIGCLQLITMAADIISELECIGGWALILSSGVASMTPDLAAMAFAQKRPREPVVHLLRGSVNDLGVPTGFATVGAFIRVDALRAFGPVTLAEYLALAERRFAVKKVLV